MVGKRTPATTSHILVVSPAHGASARTARLLTKAGYLVDTAASFEEAIAHMARETPRLLVTDVRLGAFNGLHLAHRRHYENPELPSIVTHAVSDQVLEDKAKRVGAAFLVEARVLEYLPLLASLLLEPTAHIPSRAASTRPTPKRSAGGSPP